MTSPHATQKKNVPTVPTVPTVQQSFADFTREKIVDGVIMAMPLTFAHFKIDGREPREPRELQELQAHSVNLQKMNAIDLTAGFTDSVVAELAEAMHHIVHACTTEYKRIDRAIGREGKSAPDGKMELSASTEDGLVDRMDLVSSIPIWQQLKHVASIALQQCRSSSSWSSSAPQPAQKTKEQEDSDKDEEEDNDDDDTLKKTKTKKRGTAARQRHRREEKKQLRAAKRRAKQGAVEYPKIMLYNVTTAPFYAWCQAVAEAMIKVLQSQRKGGHPRFAYIQTVVLLARLHTGAKLARVIRSYPGKFDEIRRDLFSSVSSNKSVIKGPDTLIQTLLQDKAMAKHMTGESFPQQMLNDILGAATSPSLKFMEDLWRRLRIALGKTQALILPELPDTLENTSSSSSSIIPKDESQQDAKERKEALSPGDGKSSLSSSPVLGMGSLLPASAGIAPAGLSFQNEEEQAKFLAWLAEQQQRTT